MKPTASKKLEQQIQTGPLVELETLKNKYNTEGSSIKMHSYFKRTLRGFE